MAVVSDICGQMEALCEITRRCPTDASVCQHTQLELDPFLESQPRNLAKQRCDAIRRLRGENQQSGDDEDLVEPVHKVTRNANQYLIIANVADH